MITDGEQQVIELFVRHQTRIKGCIAALMGDFAAVPDVLQETFLVVQRKAAEFEPGSNFLAWAFQIARCQVKTGVVRCDVAKQPSGQPLVFQTPHADLTVLGTAFDLLAAPVESRARIHQGHVRWADGGSGVEVVAGEACTADLQGVQAWVSVCNLDFTAMQMLPPQLETVFCDT